MKKSLVMVLVVVTALAFASSVLAANLGCLDYPSPDDAKAKCKDRVIDKGKCTGSQPLCGGGPLLKWKVKWLTKEVCNK